jgi:SAM-dependent methyltransferase
MINHNIKYWDKYYKSKIKINLPSNFAKFIKKKVLKKKDIVLDVATGNGRDSFFFSKHAKFVYGIDKSKVAIKLNNQSVNHLKLKNVSFKNLSSQQIKFFKKKVTFIYARFFIHAINTKIQNRFLDDLKKYFKKNVSIGLEFRTTDDMLINKGKKIGKNETFYTHYRRFIDLKEFEKKLNEKNFQILYKKKGLNLSKTPTENPYLCRLIIKQK